MKTRILLITFSLLFFVVAASAQELSKMYDAKVLETDSLKKHINSLDNLIKEKTEAIDSLKKEKTETINSFKKEKTEAIDSLKKEIIKQNEFNKKQEKFKTEQEKFETKQKTEQDKLKTEQDKLKTDKNEFKKNQAETRKSLQAKSDSIGTLKDSLIKSKQEQERLSSEKVAEGQKHGKEEVISVISKYYNKPFDQLAKSVTTGSITQDRDLLRRFDNQNEALKIVQNILIYKEAEQLLYCKYNPVKVNEYLGKLDSIKDSKSVQDLKELLENFELCNEQLVKIITEIKNNARDQGTKKNEQIKNEKRNEILNKISLYIFNYDIENYPHLRKIVFELIKIRQKNVEADVSDLLKEL